MTEKCRHSMFVFGQKLVQKVANVLTPTNTNHVKKKYQNLCSLFIFFKNLHMYTCINTYIYMYIYSYVWLCFNIFATYETPIEMKIEILNSYCSTFVYLLVHISFQDLYFLQNYKEEHLHYSLFLLSCCFILSAKIYSYVEYQISNFVFKMPENLDLLMW